MRLVEWLVVMALACVSLTVSYEWITYREARIEPVMKRLCNDTDCVIIPQRPNESWHCGGDEQGPIRCAREVNSMQTAWRQWVSDRIPPRSFPRPPAVPIGWSVVDFSRG